MDVWVALAGALLTLVAVLAQRGLVTVVGRWSVGLLTCRSVALLACCSGAFLLRCLVDLLVC